MTSARVHTDGLTIVSVVFGDPLFLERNVALTQTLDPEGSPRWIVVDNSGAAGFRPPPGASIRVVAGIPPPRADDAGSLHHALGLERGLELVDTRFALLLDPDFYVIQRGWVGSVLAHASRRGLAFFGSVWHPRWFYQDRSFPSVHFLLVDTEQVELADLDLRPDISDDAWWRWINDHRLPMPDLLRDTLKAGRIRDVGWRLRRRFRDSAPFECLTPHYARPDRGRARWEARLGAIVPAAWRKFPAPGDGTYTERSFLRRGLPEAYELGWEEFFWRGEPFAFHLRRVGRAIAGQGGSRDAGLLAAWLDDLPTHGGGT